MNHLYLDTCVIEVKPIRFTPAGIPVQELLLSHCSELMQAGHWRKVEFTLSAYAIGQLAKQLERLALGTKMRVEGFLAPARKNSTKIVLHLHAVQFPQSTEQKDTLL